MSDATMNTLYHHTGFLWWLYDLFASLFEVALFVLMFEWWTPTTLVGKLIKFPLKYVGIFVAFPGTLTATGLVYVWMSSNGMA